MILLDKDFKFEMDDLSGRHRICLPSGKKSAWVAYPEISVVHENNTIYIGVSAFHDGLLPIEKVLKVEVMKSFGFKENSKGISSDFE